MLRIKRHIIFIIILYLGVDTAFAQRSIADLFVSNSLKGDEMFDDFYYEEAIRYYKLALKKDGNNQALKLKIAESYRKMNDYNSSLYWFDQVFSGDNEAGEPIDHYHYAEVLVSATRYDEALDWFERYKEMSPDDSRGYRKVNGLQDLSYFYRDSLSIAIENISFNTEYDELAARPFNDKLVFLSARESNALIDHDYLRELDLFDIYSVKYDSAAGWENPERYDRTTNSNYHEGPLAFYNGKDQIILTRNNLRDGKPVLNSNGEVTLQLFTAKKTGEVWSEPKLLSLNNPEYSFVQPSLSANNDTLYYASNMDGGFGGYDIYRSVWENNDWSDPINMGPEINTEGNELYPYFIKDRLFFSSNGHAGIGGLDVFKAFMLDGKVQVVTNVGYPINSSYDDFSFLINNDCSTGMLTSNRIEGKGNDDIYTFTISNRVLTGRVAQEQDGNFISDALVNLYQDSILIGSVRTDEDGLFGMRLPLNSEFEVEVSKAGYFSSDPIGISTLEKVIDLDTIKIALYKHDLFAHGRILNNETQSLMPDVRVILHNLTDNELDTIFTNESGTYNFVIKPNKDYSIWAGKSGFLVNGVDFNSHNFFKGVIENDIVMELEYEKKSVVHFEYDKYNIKSQDFTILEKVAKAMRNTSRQLVISAFADARGTVEYNQKLSDKRAAAIENYFLAKGIDKSRIVARGFGETLILNRCSDGVSCKEIEHSKNRRAEIKIEGSTVK
ncbi:MAG: OmpA family protein [Bacteroidota bacterium]